MYNNYRRGTLTSRLARVGLSLLCLGILCVLIAAPRMAFAAERAATEQSNEPSNCGSMYPIQAGDTLSQIAKLYHLKTDELVDANQLDDPNLIVVGQWLCIPPHGVTDEQLHGSVKWSDGSDDGSDYLPRRGVGPDYMEPESLPSYTTDDLYADPRMTHEAMYGSVEWSDGSTD